MPRLKFTHSCVLIVVFVGGQALAQFGGDGSPATITGSVSIPAGVAITGTPTVSLDEPSRSIVTAASAERACTYGTPAITAALTTSSTAVPTTAQVGRTEITIINLQAAPAREVLCRVAGTPSSSVAMVIPPNMALKLSVTDAQTVNCACATSTCRFSMQEAACTHP